MKPNPSRAAKLRRSIVTIGIGLICGKSVVLVSDSKTDEDGLKKKDLNKIAVSGLAAPLDWGIIQAGKTDFATRCVELIREGVRRDNPKTCDQFRTLCEESAKNVRIHANQVFGSSIQAALDSKFRLIIGVVEHGVRPRLFILNSETAYATEVREHACIGNARNVAEYILSGLKVRSSPIEQAKCAAIYAATIVSHIDSETEAPLVAATISQDDTGHLLNNSVNQFSADCLDFEEKRQKEWSGELLGWIKDQDTKRLFRIVGKPGD